MLAPEVTDSVREEQHFVDRRSSTDLLLLELFRSGVLGLLLYRFHSIQKRIAKRLLLPCSLVSLLVRDEGFLLESRALIGMRLLLLRPSHLLL